MEKYIIEFHESIDTTFESAKDDYEINGGQELEMEDCGNKVIVYFDNYKDIFEFGRYYGRHQIKELI